MNWLKVLYRSGRQDIVRQIARENLTTEKISELAAEGVSLALSAGAGMISDERAAQIALGCERGGNALIHLTAAIAPTSEDGKAVSAGEKALICSDISTAVGALVTQDALDRAIEAVVDRVK